MVIMRPAMLIAAGLAMATSIGLAGSGAASATALKIHNHATWTLEVNGICSLATFASNGKFTSDLDGPSGGKWSGGEATIHMKWNDTGPDGGLVFNGTYGAAEILGQRDPGRHFLLGPVGQGSHVWLLNHRLS